MSKLIFIALILILENASWAQARPDLIYYQFNNTGGPTVANNASAPVGTNPAPLIGALTIGGSGQFGNALIGAGGSGNANYVDTGWATNLPPTGWTISFWFNNVLDNGVTSYFVGDATTNFRIFKGGVAGNGNLIVRGNGITDTTITGALLAQPSVVHVVYDPAGPSIKTYLNGTLNNTVGQIGLNISSAGPFKVGSYAINASLENTALMDEFRLYGRSLDAAEVASTWNINFPTPTANPSAIPILSFWNILVLTLLFGTALRKTRFNK